MDERAETENKERLWWNIKEEPRQPHDAFISGKQTSSFSVIAAEVAVARLR